MKQTEIISFTVAATASLLAGVMLLDGAQQGSWSMWLAIVTASASLLQAAITRTAGRRMRAEVVRAARLAEGKALPSFERGNQFETLKSATDCLETRLRTNDATIEKLKAELELAHREHDKAIRGLADEVEAASRSSMSAVETRVDGLVAVSKQLSEIADRLSGDSVAAASAAETALSATKRSVATTAELSQSIQGIAGQVGHVKSSTLRSVTASDRMRDTISEVSQSVRKISGFSEAIADIARQTRLLALNAGVEAARAGVNGQGFAVIAREVRDLSDKTAIVTVSIADVIKEVGQTTAHAMSAVGEIGAMIREVDHASLEMSQSIETQADATRRIAASIADIEASFADVTNNMQHIAGNASATSRQAAQVDALTDEAAGSIAELQQSIVRIIRCYSPQLDRRTSERHPVRCNASLRVDGTLVAVDLVNISQGGAMIRGIVAPLHARVTLSMAGIGRGLDAEVVEASRERTRIRFTKQARALPEMQSILAKMSSTLPQAALAA